MHMMDKRLMKESMHVTVKRGAGSGISDHMLVITKVRMDERRKFRHWGKREKGYK